MKSEGYESIQRPIDVIKKFSESEKLQKGYDLETQSRWLHEAQLKKKIQSQYTPLLWHNTKRYTPGVAAYSSLSMIDV